jgi:hypothetical protein
MDDIALYQIIVEAALDAVANFGNKQHYLYKTVAKRLFFLFKYYSENTDGYGPVRDVRRLLIASSKIKTGSGSLNMST